MVAAFGAVFSGSSYGGEALCCLEGFFRAEQLGSPQSRKSDGLVSTSTSYIFAPPMSVDDRLPNARKTEKMKEKTSVVSTSYILCALHSADCRCGLRKVILHVALYMGLAASAMNGEQHQQRERGGGYCCSGALPEGGVVSYSARHRIGVYSVPVCCCYCWAEQN